MSIYQNNLDALSKLYPDYRTLLPPTPPPYSTSQSAIQQIQDWLSSLHFQHDQLIVLGIGDGVALQNLAQSRRFSKIVVIEPNLDCFTAALARTDLTREFENPNISWLIAVPPHQLEEALRYVKTILAARGFQVLQNPFVPQTDRGYYSKITRELKKVIDFETFNLRARLGRGTLVQRNWISNIPSILNAFMPDQVVNLLADIPAVVVAAGPSLDKNVHVLKQAENRAVIIAVDTALRTLQENHITPHIAVTCDPTPLNEKHFEQVNLQEQTLYAFVPDVYYKILSYFQDMPYRLCLLDDSSRLSYRLKERLGIQRLFKRAMHVSEAAIHLALHMGCNPILFTGLDLALPRFKGSTHTHFGSHSSQITAINQDKIHIRTKEGQHAEHSIMSVPGWDGQPVLTFYSFHMYLMKLEELIASTPVQWIDATEGGAKKPGCSQQQLENALQTLPELDVSFALRFSNLSIPPLPKIDACISDLEEGFQKMNRMVEEFEKLTTDQMNREKSIKVWADFLQDSQIRAMLDHAVFPFQLHPGIEFVADENRHSFVKSQTSEAQKIMNMFIPLWRGTLEELSHRRDHLKDKK